MSVSIYYMSPLKLYTQESEFGIQNVLRPKVSEVEGITGWSAVLPSNAAVDMGVLVLVTAPEEVHALIEADNANVSFAMLSMDGAFADHMTRQKFNSAMNRLEAKGFTVTEITYQTTLIDALFIIAGQYRPTMQKDLLRIKI